MDAWIELALQYGVAGVLVVAFIWAYSRGHLATGRELQLLRDALALEQAEHLRERLELRQEIQFWRDHAWSLARVAERTSGALPANEAHG